jgi:hypothetical protein
VVAPMVFRIEALDSFYSSTLHPLVLEAMALVMDLFDDQHRRLPAGIPLDRLVWARPAEDRAAKQIMTNSCGSYTILHLLQVSTDRDTKTVGGAFVFPVQDLPSVYEWTGCMLLDGKLPH